MIAIFFLVLLPVHLFSQNESDTNFSSFHHFFKIYTNNIWDLKKENFIAIENKINSLSIDIKKSDLNILELAKADLANIEKVMVQHDKSLALIGQNIFSIIQIYNLIDSSGGDDVEIILRKCANACRTMKAHFSESPTFVPLVWHVFLSSMLGSPVVEISQNFKKEILKNYLIPYYFEIAEKHKMQNIYFNELLADSRFFLYLIEENFEGCRSEIGKIRNYNQLRYGKTKKATTKTQIFEIEVLFKEKKYDLVIANFKKMPENWPDKEFGLDLGAKLALATIAADAYYEIGNLELSKTWREVALSMMFTQDNKTGKAFALKQAIHLRNIYKTEKSWALMRNLEDRCGKFGMTPLPKQPGEN